MTVTDTTPFPGTGVAVASHPSGARIAARAWATGLVSTVPAGALHGIAHGHAVPLEVLAIALVVAAAIAAPLVGRAFRSRWAGRIRIALAILASQAFFHGFFAVATTPIGGGPSGHEHHLHGAAAMRDALAAQAAAGYGPAAAMDAGMLLAHAAAAVLTIGALWYGEALVLGIVAAGRDAIAQLGALARALGAGILLPSRPRLVAAGALPALLAQRHVLVQRGRGPPVLV